MNKDSLHKFSRFVDPLNLLAQHIERKKERERIDVSRCYRKNQDKPDEEFYTGARDKAPELFQCPYLPIETTNRYNLSKILLSENN